MNESRWRVLRKNFDVPENGMRLLYKTVSDLQTLNFKIFLRDSVDIGLPQPMKRPAWFVVLAAHSSTVVWRLMFCGIFNFVPHHLLSSLWHLKAFNRRRDRYWSKKLAAQIVTKPISQQLSFTLTNCFFMPWVQFVDDAVWVSSVTCIEFTKEVALWSVAATPSWIIPMLDTRRPCRSIFMPVSTN